MVAQTRKSIKLASNFFFRLLRVLVERVPAANKLRRGESSIVSFIKGGIVKDRRLISANSACVLGLVVALAFAAMNASAESLTVSASGVWNANAPTTTESAANESWSFSFLVSSTPVTSEVNTGNWFDTTFSNFTFTLNGSTVATTPIELTWYNTSQGGLFDLLFSDGDMVYYGAQAYSGSESNPTILPGYYPLTPCDAECTLYSGSQFKFGYWNGSNFESATPLTGDLSIGAVPEPSSLLLFGTGMLSLAGLVKRKLFAR